MSIFGLLVALNLQTAFLSPPVAMAAFYSKGVAPLRCINKRGLTWGARRLPGEMVSCFSVGGRGVKAHPAVQ